METVDQPLASSSSSTNSIPEVHQLSTVKQKRSYSVEGTIGSSIEPLSEEDIPMADVTQTDVFTLATQHSDIRAEAVDHTNEIVREGLKGDYNTLSALKDTQYNLASRIENNADRLERATENAKDTIADRLFDVSRDTYDLRAQVTQVLSEVKLVGAATAKDTEIAVLKNTIENQKNTQYLAERIAADGNETRRLINEMKYNDLNRELIERNTDLRCCHDRYDRHHGWDPVQFASQMASLQSTVQAIGSQMSDTRQSLVNLGTMVASGQTSSTNNIR